MQIGKQNSTENSRHPYSFTSNLNKTKENI